MKFLKNWKKKFSSMKSKSNLFSGVGESEIKNDSIKIKDYPFEPSSIYSSKEIGVKEISEIHLDQYPPTIKIRNELIFISREQIESLKAFAISNNITTTQRPANWDGITEPFLDTEFDEEQKDRTIKRLEKNGITLDEVNHIRNEISEQMFKYNFDTMLWDWVNLGMHDVLSAMRAKLSKDKFHEFYWRAMEIEQREGNGN